MVHKEWWSTNFAGDAYRRNQRNWTDRGLNKEVRRVGKARSLLTLSSLIALYQETHSYVKLGASSKDSYQRHIRVIESRFGDWPLQAFEDRGARSLIRKWRDELLADRPRTADAITGFLRRLLNFAVDEEYIDRNPAANLGRLHTNTRRDFIWSDVQIATFVRYAPRHLGRALLLAVWSGQRQGDLLALRWDSYDGEYIRLQQRKTGRRVKVLVSAELRVVLAEIKTEQVAYARKTNTAPSELILSTTRGLPWHSGFKCAWQKALKDTGVSGVTFHDLRGTFVTAAYRAGATFREIAEATGHDEKVCESFIRQHYLGSGAEPVITKLEATTSFIDASWVNVPKIKRALPRHTGPRVARVKKIDAAPALPAATQLPLFPELADHPSEVRQAHSD